MPLFKILPVRIRLPRSTLLKSTINIQAQGIWNFFPKLFLFTICTPHTDEHLSKFYRINKSGYSWKSGGGAFTKKMAYIGTSISTYNLKKKKNKKKKYGFKEKVTSGNQHYAKKRPVGIVSSIGVSGIKWKDPFEDP